MTVAGELSVGSETDQTIGFNVYGLLYRRKHSQKELAFALGITPSVLSKKLRGDSAWSARQVAVAASFLGVEPGRLFSQLSPPQIRMKLRALPGEGRATRVQPPLLASL